MLDRSDWTLPTETPQLAQDGLEPDAMFVCSPQLNLRLWECPRQLTQQRAQTLLEVRLRLRVSVDVARTRHPQPSAEAPQVDPAQLPTDRSPQALRHPGGDGAPIPAVVQWSRATQRRA